MSGFAQQCLAAEVPVCGKVGAITASTYRNGVMYEVRMINGGRRVNGRLEVVGNFFLNSQENTDGFIHLVLEAKRSDNSVCFTSNGTTVTTLTIR